jgi:hypothetical protein
MMELGSDYFVSPWVAVVSNDSIFWQRDRVDYSRIIARHYVGMSAISCIRPHCRGC